MQKYYQSQQNFIIHQTQDVEKTDKCSQNVKLQSNYSTTWSIEHLIHGGTLSLCHQNMASTSVLKVPPRRLEWHWVVQCSVLRKLLTMPHDRSMAFINEIFKILFSLSWKIHGQLQVSECQCDGGGQHVPRVLLRTPCRRCLQLGPALICFQHHPSVSSL